MKYIQHITAGCLALASSLMAITATSLYPANGATGVCLDAPLRINLSVKPVMGWSGAIRIRNVATNTVVKTWDMSVNPGDPNTADVSAGWTWQDSVGYTKRNVWAMILDSVPGYLAQIRNPQHLLAANTKYQVEVDAGVLKGSDASTFAGIAAGAWTFTTGSAPSSKNNIVVADDNSGDVCTIERGIELVPSSSTSAVQVLVKPGYYREMIAAKSKNKLQLYGAGTNKTFIRYLNSNNLNNTGSSYRNVVLLGGNQMSIRALSITNTISVTGAQAEAFYLQGDSNIVADVFLHSYQDTWLNNSGSAYVQDATIEGSVDFIWGYYPVYFKRTTLVLNRTGSVIVQPRNDASHHGYVFDSCTIKTNVTNTNSHFARDGGASYANGEVIYLYTKIENGTFLATAPWTINSTTDSSTLRFCEYKSMDANGTLLTISGTQRLRLQCNADSVTKHATPSNVIGWTPSVPTLASILALTATSSSSAAVSSSAAKSSSALASSSSLAVSSSAIISSSSTTPSSSSSPTAIYPNAKEESYCFKPSFDGFVLQGTTGHEVIDIIDAKGHVLEHIASQGGSTMWQASGDSKRGVLFVKLHGDTAERLWILTLWR